MSDENGPPPLRFGRADAIGTAGPAPVLKLTLRRPSAPSTPAAPVGDGRPPVPTPGTGPQPGDFPAAAATGIAARQAPETERDNIGADIADNAVKDATPASRRRQRIRNADYEVGYGKPPIKSQFKANTSGNLNGRTKGSLSLKTQLRLVVGEPVTVTENGKRVELPTLTAMMKKLRADALNGKPKAFDQFIKLIVAYLPDEAAHDHRETAAEDAALLAKFKVRKA